MTVLEIVAEVAARLEELGIRYAVGGSLASSAWGQMRQTNDADIAIALAPEKASELLEAFRSPYLIDERELQDALESSEPFTSVQLLHMDEAFKIDLFLLSRDEYTEGALSRVATVKLAGIAVRFSAPEDIVIAKLRWFEFGHRVSDRQWNDILGVLESQAGKLDGNYLRTWATHFEVADLLSQAIAEASDTSR